jgi:hypothetical protein
MMTTKAAARKANRKQGSHIRKSRQRGQKRERPAEIAPRMLREALSYAKRGWRVFPCFEATAAGKCACPNGACEDIGKHPRISKWPDRATTNAGTIRAWWKKWPTANIAITTGKGSDLIVIDVDGPIGEEALAALGVELGPLPETLKIQTGRPGGVQLYFLSPDHEIKSRNGELGDHLDVKAEGGYAIAPPSLHETGRRYRLLNALKPSALPSEWVDRLVALGKSTVASTIFEEKIPESTRNEKLISLAGSMRRRGMGEEEILAGITATNRLRCDPPLPATEVEAIARSAAKYQPTDPSLSSQSASWPAPLADEAFHGLAGEIVRAIRPHTEADDAALLIHALVMFGNAVGRGPYALADGAEHHANTFAVLVGDTATARKGTAQVRVQRFFKEADAEWVANHVKGGLSSGEGLIWNVRDPIMKTEAIKSKGQVTGYQEVLVDEGVGDKRLLLVETEFAQPLTVMRREGNILSPIIRAAWDSGSLATLTKNSPAKATDAHVSIIGHVTRDELRRKLGALDASNGFANRFLWLCAKKSKLLPFGGRLGDTEIVPLGRSLADALTTASGFGLIGWGKKAKKLWEKVYPELASDVPGLAGAVTSRAEPQVLRLALIYALLDKSKFKAEKHLKAALAVWRYCADSARYIFGDATGNSVADRVLQYLQRSPTGRTRTEINSLFGGHKSAAEIEAAITPLEAEGKLRIDRTATGGRAEERVVAL